MRYCSSAWRLCSKNDTNRFTFLRKRATKLILHLPNRTKFKYVFKEMKICLLNLELSLTLQFKYTRLWTILCQFMCVCQYHLKQTTFNVLQAIIKPSTSENRLLQENLLKMYAVVKIWNNIPICITEGQNIARFKLSYFNFWAA